MTISIERTQAELKQSNLATWADNYERGLLKMAAISELQEALESAMLEIQRRTRHHEQMVETQEEIEGLDPMGMRLDMSDKLIAIENDYLKASGYEEICRVMIENLGKN